MGILRGIQLGRSEEHTLKALVKLIDSKKLKYKWGRGSGTGGSLFPHQIELNMV